MKNAIEMEGSVFVSLMWLVVYVINVGLIILILVLVKVVKVSEVVLGLGIVGIFIFLISLLSVLWYTFSIVNGSLIIYLISRFVLCVKDYGCNN